MDTVHQVKSDNSPTAEIVGNKSPLRNSWYKYQSEEEDVALTLALQESLEEKEQAIRNCSICLTLSAELVTHIRFQSDIDIGKDMCKDSPEFDDRHGKKKADINMARYCYASSS